MGARRVFEVPSGFVLWCLSRLRDVGSCDGVRRVVTFCYCLMKKFGELV